MKVVVTAIGETLDSPVDQRFGRARYFVLYDTDTEKWSAHDNSQNLQAAQGAGIQAGQNVLNLGAEAVITGHCGPKAFSVLQAGAVRIYTNANGTVQEALHAMKAGQLTEATDADVGSHFGSV